MNCNFSMELKPIYVFQGEGIIPECHTYTCEMFERMVENPINKIDYSSLQRLNQPGTLVMPGGNGVRQIHALEDTTVNSSFKSLDGTQALQVFTKNSSYDYLGICAGAYAGVLLEIVDASCSSSTATLANQKMRFRPLITTVGLGGPEKRISVFYAGGPEFQSSSSYGELDSNDILAYFGDNYTAAVVEKIHKKSRTILMSHHPEVTSGLPENEYLPYLHDSVKTKEFANTLSSFQEGSDEVTKLLFKRLGLKLKDVKVAGRVNV